jgi:peptidoglycan hydrolase-like protein with peptidoglycan-binding domain
METRVERIAWNDWKITQADIERLQSLDPHGDLQIVQEIMPPDFFQQLEAGKWFGITAWSSLWRSGYIEKLNQIGARYEEERHEVEEQSSTALEDMTQGNDDTQVIYENSQNQFTRSLSLQSPLLRWEDVLLLQQKLTNLGYDTQGVDGIFWRKTQRALKAYQQQVLGQSWDGVMHLHGPTMQSLLWDFHAPSNRSPIPQDRETPVVENNPWRRDIQIALQENGVEDQELISRVEGSLVTLSGGIFGTRGSGSFIAPNMILTAEHVIRDLDTMEYKNITIRDAAWNRYDIIRIYVDPSQNDIAFIETKQRSQNYLPLAQGNTENRVDTEGILLWFHQNRPRFQRAQVTERMRGTETFIHPRYDERGQDFWYLDALPWDSGWPIILSDGTIAGIAIARYDKEGQGTIYETASYIQSLYNQIV